ncbi:MAG: hypothetical protein HC819_14965 [Cyclobacteriaceae bacterium]|nr:hypothetical protein [Cyclobacteriaceae bacterium]
MKTKLHDAPARKANKLSQIAMRKNKLSSLQTKVQELLGWDELQYCTLQFESGLDFIVGYCGYIDHFSNMIAYNPIFWKWWRNQYGEIDELFVQNWHKIEGKFELDFWYRMMHDGRAIASEKHPHASIIDASYEKMIKELIEEEKRRQ